MIARRNQIAFAIGVTLSVIGAWRRCVLKKSRIESDGEAFPSYVGAPSETQQMPERQLHTSRSPGRLTQSDLKHIECQIMAETFVCRRASGESIIFSDVSIVTQYGRSEHDTRESPKTTSAEYSIIPYLEALT